jgi:enoyl-CoA hydratase/carnithine racemase
VTRYRASAGITDDWQHFDFSVADGIATVTLNRPEKMNPLTFESYADLRDLLGELPHRGDARVLVIRGRGKGFCGGGDVNEIIGELIRMDAHDLMGFTKMTGDVIRAMRECPLPIIAGIQGIAAGAGSVVAIASDFRVCTTDARFAFLFTKVGLSGGDMGAAYLLPRLVGYGRATELLMLGDTIDAETADRYGLAPGRRTHPRLLPDQEPDHARARHAARPCHGARRHDAGVADDHRRSCGVPRGVQCRAQARVEGAMR